MKARQVLDDCRLVLEWLENAKDEQTFRIQWITLLALLRAVGHVLSKVDTNVSPAMRKAIDAKWKEWQARGEDSRIFWEFIEAERNNILKVYEFGYQEGDVPIVVQTEKGARGFVLDEALFTPLLGGPHAGEDGRYVAQDAISWWEEQLGNIEAPSRERGA